MVLTNRQIGATEAQAWGLVNEVVVRDELLDRGFALARLMRSKPALALRLTKERLRQMMLDGADALAVHAQYAHMVAFASGEPEHAMRQFLHHGRP
jgi:2-(1,2-epoxy-1,2-dihydrophenyl)acetyl-CoA isomerase